MKMGYRICIQKHLSKEQKDIGIEYIEDFIKEVGAHGGSYANAYRTQGGWKSWFRRGTLGLSPPKLSKKGLTLRRLSNNRRIFGIQSLDSLKINGIDESDGCYCPIHRGSIKVKSLKMLDDFDIIYEEGEIKG